MPQGSGLKHKLYWRFPTLNGQAHCFEKKRFIRKQVYPSSRKLGAVERFESLCGTFQRSRIGGGQIERPRAELRCAPCDIAEMKIRGWDESGPETIDGAR